MRKIGGVYSDADSSFLEDARSIYIYVNVNVNAPITSIPCGFEGYQLKLYYSIYRCSKFNSNSCNDI
jgi:hypothetical protein